MFATFAPPASYEAGSAGEPRPLRGVVKVVQRRDRVEFALVGFVLALDHVHGAGHEQAEGDHDGVDR